MCSEGNINITTACFVYLFCVESEYLKQYSTGKGKDGCMKNDRYVVFTSRMGASRQNRIFFPVTNSL